jgi:hypothetical protein
MPATRLYRFELSDDDTQGHPMLWGLTLEVMTLQWPGIATDEPGLKAWTMRIAEDYLQDKSIKGELIRERVEIRIIGRDAVLIDTIDHH